MSAAMASFYGAVIGGVIAVVGGAVGLVVQDSLRRRRGKIRIEAWLEGIFQRKNFTFPIRFFNDRDVNVSLWDSKVEFYQGTRLKHTETPTDPQGGYGPLFWGYPPIDLPSRTTVTKAIEVRIGDESLEEVESADRVLFAAIITPGNKRISGMVQNWRSRKPNPR